MPSVVSNTGPLLALARIDHLDLLRQLFVNIVIPPAVRAEVINMTHDPNMPHDHPHPQAAPDGINFLDTTPILNVANVAASLEYYTKVLGFEVGFAWANETSFERGSAPPTFAGVARGNWSVMLGQQVQGGPGMWAYVDLGSAAELDALDHEYQHSDARIAAPPEDKPWGRREMHVTDLDGHTFRLGAPLPERA